MGYKTLETWIEEVLSDTERKCTSLSCLYERPTGGTGEVLTHPMEGKTWDAKVLYRMFKGRAESHVQDRPGNHTFVMHAFYDNRIASENTTTFMVVDGEIKNGGAARVVTEHPTMGGLLAQLMRHNEAAMATNTALVQTMAATWIEERRELNSEMRTMRAEVNDAFAIVRESMMRENQEAHALRMQELEFKRSSDERAMMIKMAPSLLNAAAGKEVLPNELGDSAFIDQIAEKVGPEQVNQLVQLGVLKPEMAGPLIARLALAREKKGKEAKTMSEIPAGDTGNVTSITKAKG